ncbi:MAG TPA: hypothetical protein VH741_09275, partial [Candidatus Limnocylindrales bacterium]
DLRGSGPATGPLPDADQPDQDDPLGDPPTGTGPGGKPTQPDPGGGDEPGKPLPEPFPGDEWQPLPALQLWDHAAGRWYEFEQFVDGTSHVISDPGRWIDDTGRVLVRVINRGVVGDQKWFTLLARMEGTIE